MKTKRKTTWHVTLSNGQILDFPTKKRATIVAHEVLGDARLVWCSIVEWCE